MQVFEIDPIRVQAAAETSPELRDPVSIDYLDLVARLSRSEADDSLVRLAEDDGGVRMAIADDARLEPAQRLADFFLRLARLQQLDGFTKTFWFKRRFKEARL